MSWNKYPLPVLLLMSVIAHLLWIALLKRQRHALTSRLLLLICAVQMESHFEGFLHWPNIKWESCSKRKKHLIKDMALFTLLSYFRLVILLLCWWNLTPESKSLTLNHWFRLCCVLSFTLEHVSKPTVICTVVEIKNESETFHSMFICKPACLFAKFWKPSRGVVIFGQILGPIFHHSWLHWHSSVNACPSWLLPRYFPCVMGFGDVILPTRLGFLQIEIVIMKPNLYSHTSLS